MNRSVVGLLSLIWIGYPIKISGQETISDGIYIRINQVGFLPGDRKTAVLFSDTGVRGKFEVISEPTGKPEYVGIIKASHKTGWMKFRNYCLLDFTELDQAGKYYLSVKVKNQNCRSSVFDIGDEAYEGLQESLLVFMRQQRCGYNPFYDIVCHQGDGRMFYGPLPDSTYVDVSGGWHDAGDQLKYLITGSFATASMLKAYEMFPDVFADQYNELGQVGNNGIADVLDEARWGLDWIHKLHPRPDWLFHQVADDRDHMGWKFPDKDPSDYGWGPDTYRAVYFADGKPQGLKKYKSESTGVANLAGRSAAAMAIGYRIWNKNALDPSFAEKCRRAALELYEMGKKQEGFQQGNSYGAPYRYNEETWADDMEWAAAELFIMTGEKKYLADAIRYSELIGSHNWLDYDTAAHYQHYPFINMGHYVLYPFADEATKQKLAGYYRSGIEKCLARGNQNIFGIGVPFIWCSNNLVVSLSTQIFLYENMTGDNKYHSFMIDQRDWLLGKNPWGTSMFMNLPANGEYPVEVHTSTWALTKTEVPGGLIDGPVFASIYNRLIGLELTGEDEFALFQNDYVVYHDDIGDYSTNEPTMDGTAGAVILMAYLSNQKNK